MQLTVNPKDFGLEETKAADISAQFKPMLDKMVELEAEYNQVIGLPVDEAAAPAKTLRLKYVKVRTGTEKIHKEQKAFYLLAGRFVDGWKNAQLFASEGIEKKLQEIEDYAANKEKERKAALQAERAELLAPYEVDGSTLDLGSMTEQVWDNFLTGSRTNYEARKEAERIAEETRLAEIEAEKARIEAQRVENERLKKEAEEREAVLAAELKKAEQERKAAATAIEAERAEVARLAKIEADKLAAEQAAVKKLADELQTRKDTEAKAEANRIAAEKKAAKAPVKVKLATVIDALVLELPQSDITSELLEKFEGFKAWAINKITLL